MQNRILLYAGVPAEAQLYPKYPPPGPEDPLKVESLIHLASEQPEAAHHRPRLGVSILRADDLLLHHVLDNVERLFAVVDQVDHVKGLNVLFKG